METFLIKNKPLVTNELNVTFSRFVELFMKFQIHYFNYLDWVKCYHFSKKYVSQFDVFRKVKLIHLIKKG